MAALAFDFGPADGVVVAPEPRRRLYAVRGSVDTPAARAAGAPTLDALLEGAWSALTSGSPAGCPVCSSTLRPRLSAGSGIAGGGCDNCGTLLH